MVAALTDPPFLLHNSKRTTKRERRVRAYIACSWLVVTGWKPR